MREQTSTATGPRIYYICARRAGSTRTLGERLDDARRLGCDWLWIGGLQPRASGSHPYAVLDPDLFAAKSAGNVDGLKGFLADVHASGIKVVTDFIPAFAARTSALVRHHPQWFIAGPTGAPAVPAGVGREALASTLAECDFGSEARVAIVAFWAGVARRFLEAGFDGLVCRAAHRLPAAAWLAIVGAARRQSTDCVFWADTLGASIEAAEGLAGVGFEAFLSSACWWDFRSEWFLEQENRLRRLAPTIAFPEEPGGRRIGAEIEDPQRAANLARFRYRFAAAVAWGVVLPMGYEQGWRIPLGEAAASEPARFDLGAEIAALNRLRTATPAFAAHARLVRLTAPATDCLALARLPVDRGSAPLTVLLNPSPDRAGEIAAGPLFQALDVSVATARELTPGRSPERLGPGLRIALEPTSARWFQLQEAGFGNRPGQPAALEVPPFGAAPIAIENVAPLVEGGRFPVKRVLGEAVEISADFVAEGHDRLGAALQFRSADEDVWREEAFVAVDNDRWHARFFPDRAGEWRFQLLAWRDRFGTWRAESIKRRDAGQSLAGELDEGEQLFAEAAQQATGGEHARLVELASLLASHEDDSEARAGLLLAETTAELVNRALPHAGLSVSAEFRLLVERGRARTGAWYECFPRSLGENGCHGSFDDLVAHLPYIADLGFDVVYLPPIHPIGATNRKGRNNALAANADDPGSPWAIGSVEGGHTAVHPQLGTLADFRRLLRAARETGLEVALDFAVQCSPDHPWIRDHPEWFRWRGDGSIRYAENPPKKYEDIVNVDFYGGERDALWRELLGVLLFWAGEGVRIIRVDNPHTKPLPFWEWAIGEVRSRYPDIVFLSEAFTRPKLMHRLTKLGFSQSYTYFTWRDGKRELTEYLTELTTGPAPEYFRPNFWVNTPDINPYYLQSSGRPGFVIRAVLAATLAPSWGMYSGYELCEADPLRNADGSAREEYLDSEKYEFRHRNFDAPGNIRSEITALNRIRHENPALAEFANLSFHPAHNEQILFYAKHRPDNVLWILVSLDPHAPQEADIQLPLEMLGADERNPIAVTELMRAEEWEWRGRRQRIRLEPDRPAMVLRVRRI